LRFLVLYPTEFTYRSGFWMEAATDSSRGYYQWQQGWYIRVPFLRKRNGQMHCNCSAAPTVFQHFC